MATEPSTIVIDLKQFLLPIAVIITGLILGISNYSGLITIANNLKAAAVQPAQQAAAAPQAEATVSIDDDPILGNKETAKIAIVEFSDYECPFCNKHFTDTAPQIIKDYVDTGKAIIVFRDYPLTRHDPLATHEALAGECVQDMAGDQKYWEYHDLTFNTTQSNMSNLTKADLYKFASKLGIDEAKFKECIDSEKFKAEVQKDLADGTAAGVSGTPGFVIGKLDGTTVNGVAFSGALPYSSFQQTIEQQLAR